MPTNLIDEALSPQSAPPNLIDNALSQSSSPAPSANLIDSAVGQTSAPQPANLIDAALSKAPAVPRIPANPSITPAPPSVWERIKNVVTESPLAHSLGSFFDPNEIHSEWESAGPELRKDPAFALRHAPATSSDAWKALFSIGGAKQLPSVANEAVNRGFGVVSDSPIAPSAAMTADEQRRRPIVTAAGDVAGSMASGGNVAILAATAGFGELGAAGKTIARLVSAGFAASQVLDAAKSFPEILKAIQDGDAPRAQYLLARAGFQVGLSYLGAKHAATGKGAIRGKSGEPAPLAETHPLTGDEPVALVLKEQAPGVRLTESTATKDHLISEDTISEPKVPLKVFHGTTADIDSVSELDAAKSRDGAAGRGIYLTDNPGQASKYAGPGEQNTGGRVLAGLLDANAKLLDGSKPLPEPVREALKEQFPSLDTSKPYLQVLNDVREAKGNLDAVQQTVADVGDYDGVRYEHEYPDGIRKAVMLFQNSADLLKPTVPTARIVSDEHLPVVSHGEIMTEAVQRIVNNSRELQKLGLDPEKIQSRGDVPAMLSSVADKIKANLDPRVGSVITLDAQAALAKDLNLNLDDLLARKSGAAANAETAIASRALLKDSQTRVMNLARLAAMGDEAYQTKFAQSLAQHQAVLESVKGMAAEAGRALGSYRIKESELPALKISDAFAKLSPEALQKAAQLLSKMDPQNVREVNGFVEQIKPSSTADKVFEYYRNALLSSPKTVIVKTASEVAMIGLESMKKFVASGLSSDRFAAEAPAYARGALQALTHAKDILTGKFDLEDAPGFEGGGKRAIKGTLGNVVRFPGTVLERGANLMYALNYFGELRAQATRAALKEGLSGQDLYARTEYLTANPTESMLDAAHKTALHGTFQNELGKFGKNVQRAIGSDPTGLSRFLFPFFRTPINLVKASGEFSPYGLLKGLAKGDVDATSRGLIGSSIAAGIAVLALDGSITGGGPVDFRKKQTLEATGWQPYSMKIGNRYFAYHRFEPLGLVMGLVADTVHGMKTGDSEVVASSKADTAVQHIERNLSDLPFMYGLSSIVDAAKDTTGKRLDNFIARQVGSFVPAGVANVAEGIDRTVRHPQGVVETMESRILGLTGNVPPSLDIQGKPLERPVSQLGGANPFPIASAKNDAVLDSLARLGVATPIPPKTVKQGRAEVELSESERIQLAQQEGQMLYNRVAAALESDWRNLPDERKAAAIKKWRAQIDKGRAFRLFKLRSEAASAAVGR